MDQDQAPPQRNFADHFDMGSLAPSASNGDSRTSAKLCHERFCHDTRFTLLVVEFVTKNQAALKSSREVLSDVLRYNVVTYTWTKCADMITPRFNFASTVHENKIYIAGRQTTLGSVKGTSSAEFYDPTINEWKSLPNMSTLRYKCVAVSWKGKVHVVGGFAEKENTSNDPQQGQIYATERCSAERSTTR
ncbi:hypothetical protein Leryth_027546 [Lithospermum erythrorhizon]|nr:hypothetical protein Leryth_027546 [Lithospermum erythrorhizon]